MIYKGTIPLKQFKSLGDCAVQNNGGTQTLETIPWYQEIRRYKGNKNNPIYPCFDTYGMTGARPPEAIDAFTTFFSNGYKSSINLYSAGDSPYGLFRYNSSNSFGSHTRLIAAQGGSIFFTLDCNANWAASTRLFEIVNPFVEEEEDQGDDYRETPLIQIPNQYQLNESDVSSIVIDTAKCLAYNYNRVIADCSFFVLTSSNVEAGKLAFTLMSASGSLDEPALTNFSNCSSTAYAQLMLEYSNVKLWYMSVKSNRLTITNNFNMFIRPSIVLSSVTAGVDYHVQIINAKFCGFLYKE